MPANKNQLQAALKKPYDRILFSKDVLRSVFGSGFVLNNAPVAAVEQPNKTEKSVIDSVYVYGTIKLEDDKEITCYEINLQSSVRIEQSKVAIQKYVRKLLTTGQGALVNFISPQNKQVWRFTLIAKDSEMSEEGVKEKITNAKRYTYLLGPSESCKTAAERLEALSNNAKGVNLESLTDAFSVEKLNKDFYKDISEQFYKLVGATAGKGKNLKTYERLLKLPGIKADANRIYHEFAVRLIGRTVFCWFLKVKKSEANLALLPEHLLSSKAVKENPNYYHMVLEKLFFQTLNTPSKDRIKDLPEGCEHIPFLNGGLFEADTEDYYKRNKVTGLSGNINTLVIPDSWFTDFFEKLEQYNFTIDENSMTDIQVGVDPEMLGSIFENLLAEIDPDSGETARKATGSFYTPREIVDYMVSESLSYYLNNVTAIEKDRLDLLFKPEENICFSPEEKEKILIALDKVKILDPACGSGAFPMGVLHKLVLALQKLDSDAEWWIKQQVDKSKDPKGKSALREKLGKNFDYARKIGIIQNNLYGVDIQPIAAEISKLRSFLTLIVDEYIDDTQPNRGIEPLPNLEFKFVTADTLMKLPAEGDYGGLFNSNDDLDQLQQLRVDYLQSYGEHKNQLKQQFVELQKSIFKQQLGFAAGENNRAFLLSSWKPFSHEKTHWFDSEWMFGVKEFDVLIGNPPYVNVEKITEEAKTNLYSNYKTCNGRTDLYIAFIERGMDILKLSSGVLSFIIPYSYSNQKYGSDSRKMLIDQYSLLQLLDTSEYFVFDSAAVRNITIFIRKSKPQNETQIKHVKNKTEFNTQMIPYSLINQSDFLRLKDYRFETKNIIELLAIKDKLWLQAVRLDEICLIAYGARLNHKSKDIGKEHYIFEEYSKGYKPFLEGKNIDRYHFTQCGWLNYKPHEHYNSMFPELFENDKIVFINVVKDKLRFAFDNDKFYNSHTVINCVKWDLLEQAEHITVKRNITKEKIKRAANVNYLYLLALLNSKLINWYFVNFLSESLHFYPDDAKELPIVLAPTEKQRQIESIVKKILNTRKKEGALSELESEIDSIIYKLYHLTDREIEQIR